MAIAIYGAGLAGLLAANMLRRHKPVIYEQQNELPNNHHALLRFRTDLVSRETGIPFKKVLVQKAICYEGKIITEPNLRFSNMYSSKVLGVVMNRSINNIQPVERFIAPPDLISQLADGLDIRYGHPLGGVYSDSDYTGISTIPMPALMKIARWEKVPEFRYNTISDITFNIADPSVDVYQTLYYPGNEHYYRASITGSHVSIEMLGEFGSDYLKDRVETCNKVLRDFGLVGSVYYTAPHLKIQNFGKIALTDDGLRKEFILAMSDLYKVYSVGRYATWRNILLDDVVGDIRVVESLFTQRNDHYYQKLKKGV